MTTNKPRLRPWPQNGSITIANGDTVQVPRPGSFIRVREADQTFTLLVDEDTELKAEQNDVYRFKDEPFSRISIVNDSGFSLTVQLEIGEGAIETNNVSISGTISVNNASGQTVETNEHKATTLNSTAKATVTDGAAAASILAANTDRRVAILRNLSPAYTVWIGDSSVSMTNERGFPLAAGEYMYLGQENGGFTGAIYAHNDSGADIDVSLLEIEE